MNEREPFDLKRVTYAELEPADYRCAMRPSVPA
jgi:hypothetical protein